MMIGKVMTRGWLCLVMPLCVSSCAHWRTGEVWGQDATISPGWHTVKRAGLTAARDPYTWVPAAAAGLVQIGDADQDFTENLRRERPLFGSAETAGDVSDVLRWLSFGTYVGLGLAAPGGEEAGRPWRAKGKGLVSGLAAMGVTRGITDGLKAATGRTRPNQEDDESLPSGHVSATATAARLSADTLDYYDLDRGTRRMAHGGLVSLTAATAWARIEAGEHFPADVLLGAALGNFVAKFMVEAFLHPAPGQQAMASVKPLPGGAALVFRLKTRRSRD